METGIRRVFPRGWLFSGFPDRGGMPVTMSRLNLVKGLGQCCKSLEGYSRSICLKMFMIRWINGQIQPGHPPGLHLFLPERERLLRVYEVMDQWGANHGSICYGHIGADLITLASMLRIPVNMHNVPETEIFRPRAWGLFGTSEPESADYRACSVFGPLYR